MMREFKMKHHQAAKIIKVAALIYSFLIILFSNAHAGDDPVNDMLTAFSDGCSSSGDLPDRALAEANQLEGLIKSFEHQDGCESLAPLAEQIRAELQGQNFRMSGQEADLNRKKNLVQDLEAALAVERARGAEADQTFIQNTTARALELREEIIQGDPTKAYNRDVSLAHGVESVQQMAQNLVSSYQRNKACVAARPNFGGQIAAAVLSSSSVVNPGLYGSMVLGAGALMDTVVSTLRSSNLSDSLKNLETAKMSQAVGCGFEAMARTYCEARDLETLKLAEDKRLSERNCNEGPDGVQLLSTHLAQLMSWANAVNLASLPADKEQNDKLQRERTLNVRLQNLESKIRALVRSANNDVNSGKRIDDTAFNLANDIRDEILEVATDKTSVPWQVSNLGVARKFGSDLCGLALSLLTNGQSTRIPDSISDRDNFNCKQYLREQSWSVSDLTSIEANASDVLSFVRGELLPPITRDSPASLASIVARAETKTISGQSPVDILRLIDQYLAPPIGADPAVGRGARAQMEARKLLRDKVQAVLKTYDDPNASTQAVAGAVAANFAGNNGSDFASAFREAVGNDINRLSTNGKADQATQLIYDLSNIGVIGALLSASDNGTLINQINTAKIISKTNLGAVSESFQDPLNEFIDKMKRDGSPEARHNLGLTCVRTLLAPDELSDKFRRKCAGSSYDDKSGVGEMKYDDIAKQPFEVRVCSIYDHTRRARIKSLRR